MEIKHDWQFAAVSGEDGTSEGLYRHCKKCGRVEISYWIEGNLVPWKEALKEVESSCPIK